MKIQYNANMALGQVLAEGIGSVIEGEYKIDRFYRSFKRMSKDEAKTKLSITDYDGMKTCIEQLLAVLQGDSFQDNLYVIDQG